MKKLCKLSFIITILFSVFFASCYQPVFYYISQDVESEDADVSGTIASIVRYDVGTRKFLFVNADGGLRCKEVTNGANRSHGAWGTVNVPFKLHAYDYYGSGHEGEQIIKVVADSAYLYLVTCSYFDDNDEGTVAPKTIKIWAGTFNGTSASWNSSPIVSTEHDSCTSSDILKTYKYKYYYYSAFDVFCTNSYSSGNRKAFIRSGNTKAYVDSYKTLSYYQLSGGACSSITDIDGNSTTFDTGSAITDVNVQSVAYFDSKVYPFATVAVTTNESSANTNPSVVYWGNGSTVYYATSLNSENWGTKHAQTNASRTVSSLAVCSDALIIGRGVYGQDVTSSSGGIAKTSLTNGIPGSGLVSFSTNAEAQITSGYTVYALLNTEPSENELASAIYASIGFPGTGTSSSVSFSNVGLWSYYQARGNWNRE